MNPNMPRDPWWVRAILWVWILVVCGFGRMIDRVFERKDPK